MTNPNELVSKYLKEINARALPDGSPHPDDLSEAEFLATMELLEAGEIDPPEDLPPLSDRDAIRAWLDTAKLVDNLDSVLDVIAHAMKKHDKQVSNPPQSVSRLPEAAELNSRLDELLGSGIKRSSAIQTLADEHFVTASAVYQRLRRAGYRFKK